MSSGRPLYLVAALATLISACSSSPGGGQGPSGGTAVGSGGLAGGSGGNGSGGGAGGVTGSGGSARGGSDGQGGVVVGTGGRGTGGSIPGRGGAGTGGGDGGAGGVVTGRGGASTAGADGGLGGSGNGGRTGAGGRTGGTGGTTGTTGPGTGGSGAGGSTAPTTSQCMGSSASAGDVTVNLSTLQQKISGFGASTAWGSSMSAADADTLFSTTSGAGLSLHRVRIDTTGTSTSEINIAKLAVARGVTVWATPWTPPAADKDNNNNVMGHLKNGQDFASKLATFVSNMKNQGIPIYAVSAQNEPDANVDYESCVYTGDTIASFVGTYMGPALADSGVKIMAPETQNWCGFQTFWPLIKANATAMSYLSIIATHEYGCSAKAYPDIAAAGKEFWETEIYDTNGTVDAGMGSALRVVQLIHDALTVANMNAWHYWWVYATGNNGLIVNNAVTKRLWVMGNYSRFVRPGFMRVSTTGSAPANVLLTAFKNPADGTVVVVAANKGSGAASLSAFISGVAPCTLTPYVTSSSDSLTKGTDITVTSGRFTASLAGQSVTSFVGKP